VWQESYALYSINRELVMVYLKGLLISFAVSLLCVALPAGAENAVSTDMEISTKQVLSGVNINTADAEMLAVSLKGIGAKRAQAIVVYRESNGPFSDVNQLEEIKGISAAIIKENLDKIRL
jgi:competence protein ComEA